MATDNIQGSQQQSQGVALGTQGNQDMKIPQGTQGGHREKEGIDDRHILHQERSSATNKENAEYKQNS